MPAAPEPVAVPFHQAFTFRMLTPEAVVPLIA